MATTDSPPSSGYQPSARLRDHVAAWKRHVEETEPAAREALEVGIAQELTENLWLSLTVLADHLPWSAENIRLMMVGRGVPPRVRHRAEEGDPPVYTPSERLRDLLAAWRVTVEEEKEKRAALEWAIAEELKDDPGLTIAKMVGHVPWRHDQLRVIARTHNVPRRRKRASEHKLIVDGDGRPKSVTVPYDWYVQQPGADPSIVKR
jgi:hypothetical protein